MKPLDIRVQTIKSQEKINRQLKLAKDLKQDPNMSFRLDDHLCKACYYFIGFAGQAFTDSACYICGEIIHNNNTNTDKVCRSCAAKHHLCRKCGADISLDIQRYELENL